MECELQRGRARSRNKKTANEEKGRFFLLLQPLQSVVPIVTPGIAYFLIFKYIPLTGSVMAFQDYNIFAGIWQSDWIGLDNFRRMIEYADFWHSLGNTLAIGFYTLLLGFPIPITLALMMNELCSAAYILFEIFMFSIHGEGNPVPPGIFHHAVDGIL